MKKLIAAVVVAVLLAAAPWWMGGVARQRVDHAFESVPKNVPYLKIVESKWTRGWLHSEHLTTFELVLPPGILNTPVGLTPVAARAGAAPAPAASAVPTAQQIPNASPVPQIKPIRFSLRDEMLHGPILGSEGFGLARLDSQLVISEQIRKKLGEILGTDDLVQVVTRMEFFGGTTTTVSGKGRSIDLGKLDQRVAGGTVAWDDFKLVVGIARHVDSYDLDGRLPRLEASTRTGDRVLVNDITLKGSGKRIVEDLYTGGATFGIGKLSATKDKEPVVEVSAIEYGYDASKKGDFLDYAIKFGSGAIHNKEVEASGLQLQALHFDFTMRHLHIATLQKLMAGLREANATLYKGAADPQSAVLQPLKEHGLELIKHDPELAIDRLGIETAQGAGLIKGSIKLAGVTDQDLSADAMQLLQKLVADFTIEVAQALVEKIPNGATMVGAGIDAGYLKREGAKLVSHIEYRGGALLVNGKTPQDIQIPGITPPGPPKPPAPPK